MASDSTAAPDCEIITTLTLTELCRISRAPADWIVELVEEGILDPEGGDRRAWRFQSSCISVVHRVRRLQGDLRINMPGIALVLALSEENARLKRRLIQLEALPTNSGSAGQG